MVSYLKNLCDNGNFATATTDFAQYWTRTLPCYRMAEMTVQPTGTKTGLLIAKLNNDIGIASHDFSAIQGHVYYYRLWISTPNTSTKYDVTIKNASTNAMISGMGGNSTSAGKYVATHFTAPSTATYKVSLTISSTLNGGETWTYMTNLLIIDATETYGAGNEMSIYGAESDIITMGNYWEGSKELGSPPSSSIPLAVNNLITTETSSSVQVSISWNNPKTTSQPVDGYRIYQKNLTAGDTSSTSSTLKQEAWITGNAITSDAYTSCIVINLDRAQNDYSIGVGAYNARGVGPLTWVNVTKTGSGGSDTGVQTAPSTPANVSAQPGPSIGSISISWSTVPDANKLSEVDGYQIFCTSKNIPDWTGLVYTDGSQFVQLDGKSWTNYEWKNLTIGEEYSFKVLAFNEAGGSANGTIVTATPLYQLPTVPQDFEVTKTAYQQITISWAVPLIVGNPIMTGYKLYRQVKDIDGNVLEYFSAVPYKTFASTTTSFTDTDLTVKRSYSYYITSYSTKGESNKTAQKLIMLVGVPSEPQNLTADIEGGTYPVIRWNPCADDGGEVPLRFKIYCDKTNGSNLTATIDGSAYDAIQIGCIPGETYYYNVSAVNSAGEGAKSSLTLTIPAENKNTKILVIGNRITNGSFDGDMGITNWTAEPTTCISFVDAPSGMFIDKALDISGGNVYSDFEAVAGHTYLLTCKCKATTGAIQAKICDVESYVEKANNTLFSISNTSVLRQFTTAHIYGSSGIRVLIHSENGTEGIIDGVMLIDLSSTYGHNAVISVETTPYQSFITAIDGFMGGYWEKTFTLTKEL